MLDGWLVLGVCTIQFVHEIIYHKAWAEISYQPEQRDDISGLELLWWKSVNGAIPLTIWTGNMMIPDWIPGHPISMGISGS